MALIGCGIAGFGHAATESVSDREHIINTAGKLALSAALGIAMGRLAPANTIAGELVRIAGTMMGVSFAGDVIMHGNDVSAALLDNWNSDSNWVRNKGIMQEQLGRFAFDTALMTAGGIAGSRFARSEAFNTGTQRLGALIDNFSESLVGPRLVPAFADVAVPGQNMLSSRSIESGVMNYSRQRTFNSSLIDSVDPLTGEGPASSRPYVAEIRGVLAKSKPALNSSVNDSMDLSTGGGSTSSRPSVAEIREVLAKSKPRALNSSVIDSVDPLTGGDSTSSRASLAEMREALAKSQPISPEIRGLAKAFEVQRNQISGAIVTESQGANQYCLFRQCWRQNQRDLLRIPIMN
jgi:hypothetical protein